MKNFRCVCGNTLYFENTRCLTCERDLGFAPERLRLLPLEEINPGVWRHMDNSDDTTEYHLCKNYTEHKVCNWLVAVVDAQPYCRACRLNHTIPDLTKPENHVLWQRIEQAKRRLLYTLYSLNVPVVNRDSDSEEGLCFQFLASDEHGEFCDEFNERKQVLTGHDHGVITINIAEADPVQRTAMREKMSEEYRTLLGHFRHEFGHYYWGRLFNTPLLLQQFRDMFGDEQAEYTAALNHYYQNGPMPNWSETFISAYASAHPWEDFAETFAHYLHMIDTLDTAYDHGFAIGGKPLVSPATVIRDQQLASNPKFTVDTFDKMLRD